jgi:hypothetical protein
MKEYFQGRPTKVLDSSLPPGIVQFGEKWVESTPVSIPSHTLQCFIKGKFDSVIAFDDKSFGVVDFKTSEPKASHVSFYSRQLHAYAYALERPAPNKFTLSPISKLGLFIVAPNTMDVTASGQIAYLGSVTWLEIPRDDESFIQILDEVLCVLEQPTPPIAGESCPYCQYRERAREHGL